MVWLLQLSLALQWSTNWAMNTHRLGAGQFVEFIFIHEWNEIWNDGDDMISRNTNLHENMIDMLVAVVRKSKEKPVNWLICCILIFQLQHGLKRKKENPLPRKKGIMWQWSAVPKAFHWWWSGKLCLATTKLFYLVLVRSIWLCHIRSDKMLSFLVWKVKWLFSWSQSSNKEAEV